MTNHRRPQDLIVVTPYVSHLHHVPAGMVYVDEMLAEARLSDAMSREEVEAAWLIHCLAALKQRFGRQVRLRLVDPMTLAGLFLVIRYRIRRFPTVITADGQVMVQPAVETLLDTMADKLKSSSKIAPGEE